MVSYNVRCAGGKPSGVAGAEWISDPCGWKGLRCGTGYRYAPASEGAAHLAAGEARYGDWVYKAGELTRNRCPRCRGEVELNDDRTV